MYGDPPCRWQSGNHSADDDEDRTRQTTNTVEAGRLTLTHKLLPIPHPWESLFARLVRMLRFSSAERVPTVRSLDEPI